MNSPSTNRRAGLELFALSFAALFLELMVIRWVPAVVRFVAYYSNLMLISSFLGLGLGAMMARRRRDLFSIFPLIVLLNIAALLLCRHVAQMPHPGDEMRFGVGGASLVSYLILMGLFVLNTAVFVPVGQKIGRLFLSQPPLRAYAFDLGGSLCGTIVFGLFSLYHFSPAIGIAFVALIALAIATPKQRIANIVIWIIIIACIPLSIDSAAIWSPYYYVVVHAPGAAVDAPGISEPEPNLRTMIDPPVYHVRVNSDFYQIDGSIDPSRYTQDFVRGTGVRVSLTPQYMFPYLLHPNSPKVCVVGAGGGPDVEAALLSGASDVDAVEIDRTLVNLSRKFNAADVYDNPKVSLHINDARAFFQSAAPGYDMVVFGFLDSQALFSYASNVRLDGYIYTVQSIRAAYSLLKPHGMLSISFVVGKPWLAEKLKATVAEATGAAPLVYSRSDGIYVVCASPDRQMLAAAPPRIGEFVRDISPIQSADLPTDDWPFLYLSKRTVPTDYLVIIASLLTLSIVAVLGLRWGSGNNPGRSAITSADAHFFFLGLGFLLLETKSIGDCSLFFGTTWFVTMVVVSGVLLMVLAANLLAMRLRGPSLWFYLPLLASLAVLYFTPRDSILALQFLPRLAWAILVVPLPIFFAGLIFSTTFRESKDTASLLGANLIGATIGGFLEYLAMAVGTRNLLLLVAVAYTASMVCRRGSSKRLMKIEATAAGNF